MNETNAVPYLSQVLKVNDALLGLPALPLVFLGCLAVGYLLKAFPIYPNRWIPFGVFMCGIILNLFITTLKTGQDIGRALILGLIAGGLAWVAHKKVVSKWISEDEFRNGDTTQTKLPPGTGLFLILGLSAALLLTAGCNTIYKAAVILSEAEDAVMKEWATAHNDHLTTLELDRKVMDAHAKFNQAKLIAANALRAYQAGGDKAAYLSALEAARAAVGPLIDLLAPVLSPTKVNVLKANVANATQL